MDKNISVDKSINLLIKQAMPLPTEQVSLAECIGRISGSKICTSCDVPPFDKSVFDGFAFDASLTQDATKDNPAEFSVIDEIYAGKNPTVSLSGNEAVKILTGAMIPKGASAVQKYEVCDYQKGILKVFSPLKRNENIAKRAEDIKKGDILMQPGHIIDPAMCGVLASVGETKVEVYKKPRVGIISTGSELVEADGRVAGAQIRNSSAYAISGYLRAWGADATYLGIIKDDVSQISNALCDAANKYDIIITTGGVSVGDYDYMPQATQNAGACVLFWKVLMKPGGAMLGAKLNNTIILSLSGNPSAALTSLFIIGKPLLNYISGKSSYMPDTTLACLQEDFNKKSPVDRYVPGKLILKDGKCLFRGIKHQKNSRLRPLSECDVIAHIPANSSPISAGELVKVYFI